MPEVSARDVTGGAVAPAHKQPDTNSSPLPAAPEEQGPQEETLSPKFAALARKEKFLRQQMKANQAKEQAFAARDAEIADLRAKAAWGDQFKSKLAQDPWSAMIEAGLSPEQATQAMLNQPKPEDAELRSVKQELQRIKDAQAETDKRGVDAQAQQYQQAIKQIGTEVKMLINGNADYEAIEKMGAEAAVTELIEQTFHEKGYLMTIQDAAKEVEDYLVEQAQSFIQMKKLQAKAPPPEEVAEKPQAPQKPQNSTLSNRMVPSSTKPMTDREKRERAIAAFQGKLT